MSVTATKSDTNAQVLNQADPNKVSDALRKVKLGRMLSPVKITLAAITAAAVVDITSFKKGDSTVTINSGLADMIANDALPAIGAIKSMRVTTSGTANSVGSYAATDAGGTGSSPLASTVVGLAKLSDDGKSLTFLTTVTGLVIEYIPRSDADLEAAFTPLS